MDQRVLRAMELLKEAARLDLLAAPAARRERPVRRAVSGVAAAVAACSPPRGSQKQPAVSRAGRGRGGRLASTAEGRVGKGVGGWPRPLGARCPHGDGRLPSNAGRLRKEEAFLNLHGQNKSGSRIGRSEDAVSRNRTSCRGAVFSRDSHRAEESTWCREAEPPAEGLEREEQEKERRRKRTSHALGRAQPLQVRSVPKTGTGENRESGLQLHQGEVGGETV
ncbi:hypothetical protein NDU88_004728 [Pleurodeles waltl]|uniref:Uncharacterized protein n=1 Tax=Pleurodeles waltl TaxID=8319 RepID=A0AAV7UGK0_PLEWA|nr:hypothetical protein NDU88_004728 [Pleurodeles waltl]